MRIIFFTAIIVAALPSAAKCGDDEVLASVESIIRDTYFSPDIPWFGQRPPDMEMTLSSVRMTGRNRELDIYRCDASLEFDATDYEAHYYVGLKEGRNVLSVVSRSRRTRGTPRRTLSPCAGFQAWSRIRKSRRCCKRTSTMLETIIIGAFAFMLGWIIVSKFIGTFRGGKRKRRSDRGRASKKFSQKAHRHPRYDFGPRSRGYWERRASKVARRHD